MVIIEMKSYKGGDGKSTSAFAFFEALKDAQLVDLDHQKTITRICELTNRPLPVEIHEANGNFVVIDTPPYRQTQGLEISKKVDFIIVPTKATYNSLLSLESLYRDLVKNKLLKKTWLFFNEVRKPLDNTHKEIVALFRKNFKSLKIAETCWSNLKEFKELPLKGLGPRSRNQVNSLIREVGII